MFGCEHDKNKLLLWTFVQVLAKLEFLDSWLNSIWCFGGRKRLMTLECLMTCLLVKLGNGTGLFRWVLVWFLLGLVKVRLPRSAKIFMHLHRCEWDELYGNLLLLKGFILEEFWRLGLCVLFSVEVVHLFRGRLLVIALISSFWWGSLLHAFEV